MVLAADETERKGCDSPLGEPESLKQSDERSDRSRQEVAFVPAGLNHAHHCPSSHRWTKKADENLILNSQSVSELAKSDTQLS